MSFDNCKYQAVYKALFLGLNSDMLLISRKSFPARHLRTDAIWQAWTHHIKPLSSPLWELWCFSIVSHLDLLIPVIISHPFQIMPTEIWHVTYQPELWLSFKGVQAFWNPLPNKNYTFVTFGRAILWTKPRSGDL